LYYNILVSVWLVCGRKSAHEQVFLIIKLRWL
jgi:hypothetical protein